MISYTFTLLPLFDAWLGYSGSIPDVYWNVYSEEQRYKFLCCRLQKLVEYAENLGMEINKHSEAIDKLAKELAKLEDPDFWDASFKKLVEKWINDNLEYIFDKTIKQIFFGLTYDPDSIENSGRFVAYVPDSWSDIEFDTGAVYGNFDYGRLILRYNAEGSGVIDNTGRYDDDNLEQLYRELERRVARNEGTLYTLLSESAG